MEGGFNIPKLNWGNLIETMASDWRNKNLGTISWKLCLSITVYCIWAERNARLHNNIATGFLQITRKIRELVQLKLTTLKAVQDSPENRDTARKWNLPLRIFIPY